MADRYPLTVYYDASCALCATELGAIKARDRQNRLNLVDCSAEVMSDDAPTCAGISRAELMKAMHLRDAHGKWLNGIDAFAAIYDAVGMRSMAKLYSSPRLKPFWVAIYPWIARNRNLLSRALPLRLLGWLKSAKAEDRAHR